MTLGFDNAGFETPLYDDSSDSASSGLALSWSESFLGTAYDFAQWNTSDAHLTEAAERFENGWSSPLETSLSSVDSADTETFETQWATGMLVTTLGAAAAAVFDTAAIAESVEDFEEQWSSPILLASGVTFATAAFGTSADAFDDFERSAIETSPSTSTASYSASAKSSTSTPNAKPYEMFEPFQPPTAVTSVDATTDKITTTFVPPAPGLAVGLYAEDEGELPGGVSAGKLYPTNNISAGAFVLTSVGGSTIDLTSEGLAPFYVYPDPGRYWYEELI